MPPAVPLAHVPQDDDAEEGDQGKPGDAALAARHDHERSQQRSERGSGVPAHLEERLGESVPSARGDAGDAGGLRVEDGRSDADQRRRRENGRKPGRESEQQETD
jgi:hypothetical protein